MSLKHVPVYSSFSENLGERTGRDRDGKKQVNHFAKWLPAFWDLGTLLAQYALTA